MFIKSLLNQFRKKPTVQSKMGGYGKFHGFYDDLVENIENSEKAYKDITRYCPPFFQLLCKILNDRFTDWHTKLMIDAALAYFVLPDDVIPDHKEAGYVDDLFIVCHVLKEIKDTISPDLLSNNWEGEGDILFLVDSVYDQSSAIVDHHKTEILRKVGLHKYQSLDLGEYSGTYPKRLARIANEKRELLALLAFLVKKLYKVNIRGLKINNIKELLQQYGDYDEIQRLIELSKMNHDYIPKEPKLGKKKKRKTMFAEIDQELKAARMKAMIDCEGGE